MNMPPGGPSFSFVVFSDPVPLVPVLVIAYLEIMVGEIAPVELFVTGYSYDLPFYRVDDPYGTDYNLYPSSGSVDSPVATINGEGPISSEDVTWGSVKAMYR
jgi:hypothetical protein